MIKLSQSEIAHMKSGNRILIVQPVNKTISEYKEVDLWNIAIFKDNEVIDYIPSENGGYINKELAKEFADCYCVLSEDQPLVKIHDF